MGERNNRQGSGQGGNFLCMEQTIPKGESPKATQRGKLLYYLPVNNNQCGHSLLSSFPRDPMLRIFCLKSTNVLLGPGKFTSQNEGKRQTFWTEPIGTCPLFPEQLPKKILTSGGRKFGLPRHSVQR